MFAGRFTLDDVESVCASEDVPAAETLDVLSSLVDKSLVTKEETKGLACYRLHETMREFAGLKLAEAVEEEAVELRCAEYYRARCAVGRGEAATGCSTGSPGRTWRSTTSARSCAAAWTAVTPPPDSICPPRPAGTGSPARPARASAGWTSSSRPVAEAEPQVLAGRSSCAGSWPC